MRVYIIFYKIHERDGNRLFIPIKRAGLDYAGMPQFFGGKVEQGESIEKTLAREVKEESDGKIVFNNGEKRLAYEGKAGGEDFKFYYSNVFSGDNFLGPINKGEMAAIKEVNVPEKDRDYDIDDMLKALGIVPTEAFISSETYLAFEATLKKLTQ